ncbi:MAG: chromosome segregation SMC family protein, partial [Paracoccaceae bacterium]
MRLTKLRLNGFKSFVDSTDLIIADGLTGVVGPNGCGKSNLLEAMRWVMGENRPKAIRGDGMEDVIFAGSSTRPARNFAEVSLQIDNTDRLAPAGFNESDMLDITRRITRDAGSAFKVNSKDVRARDVQMLFADASTGAHSPALVRQGQISELINARPKARRRVLEEAAGISGLYQRRHEAELKLNGAANNLLRVEDVVEQLAAQLGQLARQARQAARYRAIGEDLRRAEGILLYRRWKEAEDAFAVARDRLRAEITSASAAERGALDSSKRRETADAALPALREEEAIAAAVLQRLLVQRDTLADQESRATATIENLTARIGQLVHDMEREETLNRDAGDTIERLEWEARELGKAAQGHDERLKVSAGDARDAAQVLQERETALSELTEDVARLSARHLSAHRMLDDSNRLLDRSEAEASQASGAVDTAKTALTTANELFGQSEIAQAAAAKAAEDAEGALIAADDARSDAQTFEAKARVERSAAEGETNALRAEVAALARLVERDTAEGGQVLDLLRVDPGYEKALGAALADDLRAPAIDGTAVSGWATLPAFKTAQSLPKDVSALTNYVSVPGVLARRMSQVGLVDAGDGARLQAGLLPGQRLVSVQGDLWRWDGFRAGAEDAPSAAALRLQQLNRLQELKQDLEEASAKSQGAVQAQEVLKTRLTDLTDADRDARETRRDADRLMAEASRALSRAEADRNISSGKLESLGLAVTRHNDEAIAARSRLAEAKAAMADLGDLDSARAQVEDVKLTVEAARATMITRRSAHEELRREGEARVRRSQVVTKELSGWKLRLETAAKRIGELVDRKQLSEAELATAISVPDAIAKQRSTLAEGISTAEIRRS